MLTVNLRKLASEISRRKSMQLGSVSLPGMLTAPGLFAGSGLAAEGDGLTAKADHCIVLFLNGGPSHLDMWDMKPEAPREIRGEFDPITSSLAGVPVSEHLPRLSQQMHRATSAAVLLVKARWPASPALLTGSRSWHLTSPGLEEPGGPAGCLRH